MNKLVEFVVSHSNDDIARLLLEKGKYPDIDMELAVNCIESRRKLKGKVQEWYDRPELFFPLKLSAEQCSSSATGRYKALLAESIISQSSQGNRIIADLTGGLGVDSWFFSKIASKVIYNEMQKPLCQAAMHNFRVLGANNIEIINRAVCPGECIDSLRTSQMPEGQYPDLIYADPARRDEGGRKVFLLEDCTPDILTLKDELLSLSPHLLIKLSPMADITMVCAKLGKECRQVHIVSSGGECKELLIWLDREWRGEYSIVAAVHHQDSVSKFSFFPSEEIQACPIMCSSVPCHGFLFEPDKSLTKAGAFGLIAERFSVSKLGRSTHYYITDSLEKAEELKEYGKVYSIMECCHLDKRSIKEVGKKYPKSEVTARNIPMDTDTLRKKAGVTSGDDAHIFGLKCDSNGNLLIVAKRI